MSLYKYLKHLIKSMILMFHLSEFRSSFSAAEFMQ